MRDERGSGSILLAGLMVVAALAAAAAAAVAGYLIAAHRAEAAADLAALSGATVAASGRDGCAEARRTAVANRVRLISCGRVGDQQEFVLSVTVEVGLDPLLPGLPRRLRATAHAGPVGE